MVNVRISKAATWTIQPNDLGWIVTNQPLPLSGAPAQIGWVVACQCFDQSYAVLIANLLNRKAEGLI
jgi:hypothetical protein